MTAKDPMQDRLAAARARRAEAERARAEANEEQELTAQVEREERAAADAEALAALEQKYGRVADGRLAVVETRLGNVILKPAHAVKFRRFADIKDPSSDDITVLVEPCIVHPKPAEWAALYEQLPGVLTLCGNAVTRLAGITEKAIEGKSGS